MKEKTSFLQLCVWAHTTQTHRHRLTHRHARHVFGIFWFCFGGGDGLCWLVWGGSQGFGGFVFLVSSQLMWASLVYTFCKITLDSASVLYMKANYNSKRGLFDSFETETRQSHYSTSARKAGVLGNLNYLLFYTWSQIVNKAC